MFRACTGPRGRLPRRIALLLVALLPAGCGDGIERCPVEGRVLIDGQPLRGKAGSVLFKPDGSKGNASPHEPSGLINEEGGYTLFTSGKKGAPPGWYKVVVSVTEKGADREARALRLFHPRFGSDRTTTLVIEVAAEPAPDQYDLKLTKK